MIDGPTLLAEALRARAWRSRRCSPPAGTTRWSTRPPPAGADRARGQPPRCWPGPPTPSRRRASRRWRRASRSRSTTRSPRSRAGPLALVLVDVADPGNAGTLVRAAEAAGAAAVLFCGSSVDPSNGEVRTGIRGGAVPRARSRWEVTWDRCWSGWATSGCAGRPPSCRAARPTTTVDLTGPVALVLGSEAHGLAADGARRASTSGSRSRWRAARSRSTWRWPARCCASSRSGSGERRDDRDRDRPAARRGARARRGPHARGAQRRRPRRARRRRRRVHRPAGRGVLRGPQRRRRARAAHRAAVHRGPGRPRVPPARRHRRAGHGHHPHRRRRASCSPCARRASAAASRSSPPCPTSCAARSPR